MSILTLSCFLRGSEVNILQRNYYYGSKNRLEIVKEIADIRRSCQFRFLTELKMAKTFHFSAILN